MSQSLVQQTKPVLTEGLIVLLLGLVIIYNITATDISFHGKYVGKLIEICHPKNISQECMEFREWIGVPSNAQMELGNPYWSELARQAFFIGVTMFLIRIAFSYLLQRSHMQKIRISSVLMAVLYGVVGYGLFIFGLLDTLYFVLQGQPTPLDLAWLNEAGIFQISKGWDGNPSTVSATDLYLTNFVGVLVIGSVLIMTMISFKEANVRKGIA